MFTVGDKHRVSDCAYDFVSPGACGGDSIAPEASDLNRGADER